MFKKIVVIFSLAVILPLSSLAAVDAAVADDLVSRLMSAPKEQWGDILSRNKADINDSFLNKLTDNAQSTYVRKDYGSSWKYMELADYAKYIKGDRKDYNPAGQFFLGRLLLRDNETDWALKVAGGIESMSPGSSRASMLRGKAYLNRKEADRAIPELKSAVGKDPDLEDAQLSLAYAYILKDDVQSSIKPFREVLRINPNNSYAKDALALLTSKSAPAWRSDNAEAMKYFSEAEKFYSTGKYQEAIAGYGKAIEADPKFAKAWVYMGDAYLGIGNSEKGIECYRKAIELNPKDRQAHRFLGDVLEKKYDRTGDMKYLDEAIASFENAVEVDPEYATAISDLKRAKEKKGTKN
jgi:tetratricopeptide (TPR) repeat protein